MFIRFSRIFPALHLCPSDTQQTHARRAGMLGLRHKPRHNRIAVRLRHFEARPLQRSNGLKLDNSRKPNLAPGMLSNPRGVAEGSDRFPSVRFGKKLKRVNQKRKLRSGILLSVRLVVDAKSASCDDVGWVVPSCYAATKVQERGHARRVTGQVFTKKKSSDFD